MADGLSVAAAVGRARRVELSEDPIVGSCMALSAHLKNTTSPISRRQRQEIASILAEAAAVIGSQRSAPAGEVERTIVPVAAWSACIRSLLLYATHLPDCPEAEQADWPNVTCTCGLEWDRIAAHKLLERA